MSAAEFDPALVEKAERALADHEYVPLDADMWACKCGWRQEYDYWAPDEHRAHQAAAVLFAVAPTLRAEGAAGKPYYTRLPSLFAYQRGMVEGARQAAKAVGRAVANHPNPDSLAQAYIRGRNDAAAAAREAVARIEGGQS